MFRKFKRNKQRGGRKERVAKFKPNSYTHLRSNVEKAGTKKFLKRPALKTSRLKMPNLRVFYFLGILLLLVSVIGAGSVVIKSDLFLVKNFNIKSENDELANKVAEQFIGRNIFSFGNGSIDKSVKNHFEYVTQVYIRKELPDTLYVEFVQDKPAYEVYMIDSFEFSDDFREIRDDAEVLNRQLTMNDEGIVLQSDAYVPTVTFSLFDLTVLKGEKVIDSDEIRGIYKSSLETEEEKDEFDWDLVPVEEKESIYNELASKTNIKLAEFYNSFRDMPEFSRFVQYAGKISDKGSQFDRLGKNQFTLDVLQLLEDEDYQFHIPVWLTPTTLMIDLQDGRRLYFSSGRSFEDQLRDLKVIFDNNIIISGTVFDLRTSNFSVSN